MIYAGVLKPFVGAISVGFLISLIIVIWLMWRYRKWGKDRFLTESLVILVVFIASLITVFLLPTYNDEDEKYGEKLSSCRMIEENAFNGSLNENVNKIDCDGVITNIPVSTYQKMIYAYQEKNKGG